jgi:hypothetical protein
MDALKRRRAEEEKKAKEAAVDAYRALLERSNLKSSSTWRKMQSKLADTEEYEVRSERAVVMSNGRAVVVVVCAKCGI